MSDKWNYQVRVNLTNEAANMLLDDPVNKEMGPLTQVLKKHNAIIKSQYEAFSEYVAESERHGAQNYPLYEWTKDTINDPVKEKKYRRSFSLYIDGQEVYPKAEADALEVDLQLLAGGQQILKVFKYDTNPANNPQPPAKYS